MRAKSILKEEIENLLPDEDECLEIIFKEKYGGWNYCPVCYKRSKFYRVRNRKCFACQYCGFQVHPLKDTIYHKSSTPLRKWFYVMYLYSKNSTISAKEIQRQVDVTYKTAWRMLKLVKMIPEKPNETPVALIEINENYITNYIERLRR